MVKSPDHAKPVHGSHITASIATAWSCKRHKADMCRFGDYDLHDLIELDQQTVGIMIQADAETCQVLTNRNAVSCHPGPAHHAPLVCLTVSPSVISHRFPPLGFLKTLKFSNFQFC